MITFLLAAHNCSTDVPRAQSSDLVGRWKVELTFADQTQRSLRFDAAEGGKGSFTQEGPRSNWDDPAKPSIAKWTTGSSKRLTFSGPIEFPIGNVGRETGTLVFNGTFEKDDLISGEFQLFPLDQDPTDPKGTPSKTGKFKATRVSA